MTGGDENDGLLHRALEARALVAADSPLSDARSVSCHGEIRETRREAPPTWPLSAQRLLVDDDASAAEGRYRIGSI
jgi:hypothetical protein